MIHKHIKIDIYSTLHLTYLPVSRNTSEMINLRDMIGLGALRKASSVIFLLVIFLGGCLSFSPVNIALPSSTSNRIDARYIKRHGDLTPQLQVPSSTSYLEAQATASENKEQATLTLMNIASAHFVSQALSAFVQLGVADIIGDKTITLTDIKKIIGEGVNEDALLRSLRLLASAGILKSSLDTETQKVSFCLTEAGALLQTESGSQSGLSSCVMHWMEEPLWNSWLHLPSYIKGTSDGEINEIPFVAANRQSSYTYYNKEKNPHSLQHANDFVRFIHNGEIESIVKGLDWSEYENKIVLDIGGHNGKVMAAIVEEYPRIICKCLDLPGVISNVREKPANVELVGGDIFDPSSIPPCDVIVMKHFLDRCMWDEDQTVKILKAACSALPKDGHVILGEAVVPNAGDECEDNKLQISLDALYMLVGRERQRTESEWRNVADRAGLRITQINHTSSASCSLIILQKKKDGIMIK